MLYEVITHELRVTHPSFIEAERTVSAGAEGIELVLEPGGCISGRVVDEAAQPVISARVGVDVARPSGPWADSATSQEPDGRFTCCGIPAGSVRLGLYDGELPAGPILVELRPGEHSYNFV